MGETNKSMPIFVNFLCPRQYLNSWDSCSFSRPTRVCDKFCKSGFRLMKHNLLHIRRIFGDDIVANGPRVIRISCLRQALPGS